MAEPDWGPFSGFLESLGDFLLTLANGFNTVCSFIFQYGNIVFFIIFLLMGINLLFNAKNKEYHEKIYAKNLEYIKKRGRIGTVICILLSIGFLSKGFFVFLEWCFGSLPTPVFFYIGELKRYYHDATSVQVITSFSPLESSLYFLFSLFSLISIITVAFGIYLLFFNKRILRTKFKSHKILLAGVVLAIVYGIPTSVRLMI
jgi:hypothetical protein